MTVEQPLFHYRVAQGGMLLSLSGKRHCTLWGGIRKKHAAAFRLGALWRDVARMAAAALHLSAGIIFSVAVRGKNFTRCVGLDVV